MCKKILLYILFSLYSTWLGAQSLQELYQNAQESYTSQDYQGFLHYLSQADSLRPNHPSILYQLGMAQALNQQKEKAISTLERVIWMNADIDLEKNEAFAGLKVLKSYAKLKEQARYLGTEVRKGTVAFRIADKHLHPEGIAYDPAKGTFYISSIRQRKIICRDAQGNTPDFAQNDSLYALMGLKVDSKKKVLWACSTPVPEMQGYDSELDLYPSLIAFDLDTGAELERYTLPQKAWLGDLTISPRGDIYVSNSDPAQASLYRLAAGEKKIVLFKHFPELSSLQGLSFDKSGAHLFFSDYRAGLFKMQISTKQYQALENLTPHPLKGIDGLYYHQNKLIAICNGLRPFQVLSFDLDDSAEKINSFQYLDKALPEMQEPTLGLMVEDVFYYIANSPWAAYDADKNLLEEKLSEPFIMQVKLP